MTGETTGKSAATTEIGLVLQGGGALGAYEYGGILALLELMDEQVNQGQPITLRVVTGVSIGAINAACVVGADGSADARRRLSDLWNDLIVNAPSFLPPSIVRNMSLLGVEHFYKMRVDVLTMPRWTYVYDTHPLLDTLSKNVDFAALNASKTAFVVTAVDVERGELTRFANQKVGDTEPTRIEPRHVLASGSLPPQFPWTQIGAGANAPCYWDGGVVDNTPLGDAIDAFDAGPDVRRVLVVMNLFPQKTRLPQTFAEVSERADQLRFGNRLLQDSKTAGKINKLISTIDRLAALLPGGLPEDLRDDVMAAYKFVEPVEISLGPDNPLGDEYGFRDFSRQGVEARRDLGRAITLSKLRPIFAGQLAA